MNNCSLCSLSFDDSNLFESSQGDFLCKECFKREYYAAADEKKAKAQNTCECKDNAPPKPRPMFTEAEISAAIRKKSEKGREVVPFNKPLECPYADCNSCISVFDLLSHFQREHKTVPVISTQLDSPIHLSFNPSDFRYGIKHVFCLLKVSPPKPQLRNRALTHSLLAKQRTTQTMVVLASRVGAAQLAKGNRDYVPDNEEEGATSLRNSDRIVIWIASNLFSNNHYTAAVSSISETPIRFKYYGPVLQLVHSPEDLCLEGQCLILTRFHLSAMTENGSNSIDLDVVVHSED